MESLSFDGFGGDGVEELTEGEEILLGEEDSVIVAGGGSVSVEER